MAIEKNGEIRPGLTPAANPFGYEAELVVDEHTGARGFMPTDPAKQAEVLRNGWADDHVFGVDFTKAGADIVAGKLKK